MSREYFVAGEDIGRVEERIGLLLEQGEGARVDVPVGYVATLRLVNESGGRVGCGLLLDIMEDSDGKLYIRRVGSPNRRYVARDDEKSGYIRVDP